MCHVSSPWGGEAVHVDGGIRRDANHYYHCLCHLMASSMNVV